MSALKSMSTGEDRVAFVIMELKYGNDAWVFTNDDWSAVASLDTLEGMVVRVAFGYWVRRCGSIVQPYMWGAVGYRPDVAIDNMVDNYPELQCMLNVAGYTGSGIQLPDGRNFRIDQGLYARITRQQAPLLPLAQDSHFSDCSAFTIFSFGTAQLIAGNHMVAMLTFQYNGVVGDVLNYKGPDSSTVTGLMMNCNNLAWYGIDHDYTSKTKIHNNKIFNTVKGCIHWVGSAQADVSGNVLKGQRCIIAEAGNGGDLKIGVNDYYFPLSGGRAIYIEDSGDILISGGVVNSESVYGCIAVEIVANAGRVVRHVVVEAMEWSGCQIGVYTHGAGRIFGLAIRNNHATSGAGFDRPAINPGMIALLQNCDEFIIDGNFANGMALSDAYQTAIVTIGCRDGQIVNQGATNYLGSAWYDKGSDNVHWLGGIIRDVAKGYDTTPICYFDDSIHCSFNPFSVTQSNPAYGQSGIYESGVANDNYSDRTKWYGVSNLFTQVGAQSRFAAL